MKDVTSGKMSKSKTGTDWDRLRRMGDSEVRAAVQSDPDIGLTDAAFWKNARLVGPPYPKQIVMMRLDVDVLEWFRRRPGYQTRINSILRTYMAAQREVEPRKRAAIEALPQQRKQRRRRSGS